MDLLPHPRSDSGGIGQLDVPCVADAPYSGSDFWDFPLTHGFGDRWITLPAPRLASLAQSWLFFGTISEFLGRQIDYREFKSFRRGFAFDDRGHPEGSNVSSKPLIPLLEEWIELRRQRSKVVTGNPVSFWRHPRNSRSDNPNNLPGDSDLHQLAGFLDKVFDLAEDFEQLSQGHIYPIPVIILSVKVLCITLSRVLREQYQLENGNREPMLWPGTSFRGPGATSEAACLPTSQLLLDMFQQHGWCPFHVGKIMSTHNYAVVYYFTRLYRGFSADLSHRGCSETECLASNTRDFEAYRPTHTDPSCRCRHRSVQPDHIRDIILEGGVPLVRVNSSTRRRPSIKVVKMTPWTTPFTAFSHVWQDTGLGNSRANSLPKCQLSRLQTWADFPETQSFQTMSKRKQSHHRYFWIDTLCIPAGDSTNEARIQAINKIPAILQAAQRVVVLDKSFLDMSMATTEPCELTARLSVSPWSSRCWAYLEASLGAEGLEVQCVDGTFRPYSTDDQERQTADHTPQNLSIVHIIRTLIAKFAPFRASTPSDFSLLRTQNPRDGPTTITATEALIKNTLLQSLRGQLQSPLQIKSVKRRTNGTVTVESPDLCTIFIHAWNELSKRSTTLPQDKQIILATLLGFNTQPIQRTVDPQERMATILGNMDGLPLSLFLSPGVNSEMMKSSSRNQWIPPYPSPMTRLISMKSSQYNNIRSDNLTGDLYFPNNRISRRAMSVLIVRPPEGALALGSSREIRIWDRSDKREMLYTVKLANHGCKDSLADGSEAYCLLFRRISQRAQLSYEEPRAKETGSLFRIRRIVQGTSDPDPEIEGQVYGRSTSSLSLWKSTTSLGVSASMPTPSGVQLEFSRGNSIGINKSFGKSDLSLLLSQQHQHYGPAMAVRVAYECSVTVTPDVEDTPFNFGFSPDAEFHGNHENSELLAATPLPPNWQLVLERDGPPPLRLRSHLPSYQASMAIPPISTTFLLTAIEGLVAAGSVSMSLAICFTLLPLHMLSPLSSISVVLKLVLHSVSIIQLMLFDDDSPSQKTQNARSLLSTLWNMSYVFDLLHLVTVAIYTVSRVIATGRGSKLNILDKSFIYWSFLGHTVNILARMLVTRYLVMPRLWSQYLASFDDGSEQTKSPVLKGPSPETQTLEKWKGGIEVSSRPCGEVSDDDELTSGLLVPPWETHSRKHPVSPWDMNSHHCSETTYPYPMEVSRNGPAATSKRKGGTAKRGGLKTLLTPLSTILGEFTLPGFMNRAGDHTERGLLTTQAGDDAVNLSESSRVPRWGMKGTRKQKGKQQKRRRKLRTESMVVEAPSTAAGSEYWDRTSWRSGDYLLGDER
ncbi:hypothetical protein V8F33_008788 [Rhypophila sp. PSN 637]